MLLIMLTVVVFTTIVPIRGSVQSDIPPPAGSGEFGTFVAFLPNGNIIVTDPLYDAPGPVANVGAVHLFNGVTLALIASLTGSLAEDRVGNLDVVVLPNGNYVVRSTLWGTNDVGSVTFCNMATGCNGTVSAANSLIGGTASDTVGNLPITILSDGDFVVRSTNWDKPSPTVSNVGATTFCSGTTGCPIGLVTAANSLIGSTASDFVGNGGVTALSNGNYVVRSSNWDNPAPIVSNVGAVSFCNGTTGCTGAVSGANSLIGVTASDQVGSGAVTALADGDFVVRSPDWDNNVTVVSDVGAATFCNGTTGCTGTISPTNSLVGTLANDRVSGGGVTELANGNYVVNSAGWDNPAPLTVNAGASTWCSGTRGCTGAVTTSNSLFGSTNGDLSATVITALPNGNYVVRSVVWDNGAAANAGAATFCLATGCTGPISTANSLVGSTTNDNLSSGGITFRADSSYTVSSPNWDDGAIADAGMIAFCFSPTGCHGETAPTGASDAPLAGHKDARGSSPNDHVGSRPPIDLGPDIFGIPAPDADPNNVLDGGFFAIIPSSAGPITRIDEAFGFYGTSPGDKVGLLGAMVLKNRKFVFFSPRWNGDTGAVTYVDMRDPNLLTRQPVTTGKSFTGTGNGACMGATNCSSPLPFYAALTSGAVAVGCPNCAFNGVPGAGTVTKLDRRNNYRMGEMPTVGNSVGGRLSGDMTGADITALDDGNYNVIAPQITGPGGEDNAGAVFYGAGLGGTSAGPPAVNNAVFGNTSRTVTTTNVAANEEFGRFLVSLLDTNRVTVYDYKYTVVNNGPFTNPLTFDLNDVPGENDDVVAPNGLTLSINDITPINSLEVGCTGAISGASPTSFFVTHYGQNFCATGDGFLYMGTNENGNNAYSPAQITVTDLAGNPSALVVVDVYQDAIPFLPEGTNLGRTWFLETVEPNVRANARFDFLPTDLNGDPQLYDVEVLRGSNLAFLGASHACGPAQTCIDTVNNFLQIVDNDIFAQSSADISAGIPPCPIISLNPTLLPNGTVGAPYNQTFTPSGGTPPFVFSVTAGTLPPGMTLNATTGELTGAPTTSGIFNLTIAATDANNCIGTQSYSVTINPAPTATSTNTPTDTPTSTPTDTPTNTPTDTPTSTPTDTPTATPTGPPMISGTVTYGNALGNPPPPRFVSNVLISGAGSVPVSVFTGGLGANEGQYSLSGFGAGSYTVTPTKTGGINGGISSFDAARIALHVAGPPNPQLTATQLIVADVSGNGVVSSFDAGMIAKFVAGPPYLPPGIGAAGTWRFTPLNRSYASVTSNITGEDYVGLLMGEVSGNWNNTGARPIGSRQLAEGGGPERGIAVELPQIEAAVGKEIIVPVNVEGVASKGIISYEFDLRYDPAVIQPMENPVDLAGTVSRGFSVVTNATEPGVLRAVVYGVIPIDEDGLLLNLRFMAVGAAGSVSPLMWERIMFNEGEPRVMAVDGQVDLF